MAKGLSPLQQTILLLAYENDEPHRAAAYEYAEKVEKGEAQPTFFFDYRKQHTEFLNNPHYHEGYRHFYRVSSQELYHFYYGLAWSDYRWEGTPTFVAETPTNAMKVAVSKAFKRLEERGLGINARGYGHGGFCLTPDGVAKARELSANNCQLSASG